MTSGPAEFTPEDQKAQAVLGDLRRPPAVTPATLTPRILGGLRERRRPAGAGHWLDLDLAPDAGRPAGVLGAVRVRQQVVADLARVAAARQRGVRVVSSSVAVEAASPVVVVLALLFDGREPLPAVAAGVRKAVRTELGTALALATVEVDLTAVDLWK